MAWGTVTIGGIPFREELSATDEGDGLLLAGQESHPPSSRAHVQAAHANIRGLRGLVVPVVFTDKADLSGFYRVVDSSSRLMRFGSIETATWQARMERVGGGRDVEVESQVPRVARTDTLAGTQTATYWHAPPIGVTSYLTGLVTPTGFVDRTGVDGVIRVHTGIPIETPRWTVPIGDYMRGAVRLVVDGQPRIGLVTPSAAVWEVNNGLVRILIGNDGALQLATWDAGAWRSAKSFSITVGGIVQGGPPEMTIIRNDPEEVVVRLTYPQATAGRLHVDLSLRRGSRFVVGTLARHSSAVLGVRPLPTESTGTVVTGAVLHAADADGNRTFVGSPDNPTLSSANGGISKSAATTLPFFVGYEVGPSPAVGDTYADLLAQYLGTAGERVRVVRR